MRTDPTTAPGAGVPLWNIANVLTILRIAMVPVFAVLLLQGGTAMRLAATAVFLAAAVTDKIDGHLARSRGLVTDFGKLADPIADKALVLSALVLLSVQGLLPWWVTVVITVRELGVTLLRFVMVRRSVMAASKGGKLKTVLQVVFITGLLLPWSALLPDPAAQVMQILTWAVVLAAVVVTVVTAVDYLVQAVRLARRGPGRTGP
ncbi:CDP-diacylglycerol--glycerol-3-phosphate 3-phosphatidyltransferase [Georgenia sp. 10Sc9-8]|uniref:CDP-diacylglycerol--glycerol-3-phosphate 3-phosphatidyltransferase n=1 Tax=Georgenia halotolerans TaxID=3028317 RepID=A0ABT5TXN7_9MICO|nr:CDP-diacylglycerol--glycerol-3-phosphate 3-phosphatidyltransferase [Georgenia halotolerans]